MIYCIDDRHGTPCPHPNGRCTGCKGDECDPAAVITADSQIAAARAAGWSEDYIAAEIAAGRLTA